MPIGAIAGATAVVGIGSAVAGSSAQKKAASTAAAAQTAAANQNNALAKTIYDTNRGVLSPFVEGGYGAANSINALLGIAPTGSGGGSGAPGTANPVTGALSAYAPAQGGAGQATPQAGALSPYQIAFDNYRNSTGYTFRTGEGQKALNASFAARGLGNSGAAAKAAITYGQNTASDEYGRYMGYLGQQQNVGLSAASALAGVGNTYAAQTSANNNNAADATSGAALKAGNATAGMWNGIAGSVGNALGTYGLQNYGSSYGGFSGQRNGQRNPYGVLSSGGGIY